MVSRQLVIPKEAAGKRLDVFLSGAFTGVSRSQMQRLIHQGQVRLNGKIAAPGHHLKGEEQVEVDLPEPEATALTPEAIALEVVYEDAHLLVINKPPGLVVHPGAGRKSGTLVNALLARGTPLSTVGGEERPGIVHRLDKDTSGLLVIAKDNATHRALGELIQERKVARRYLALVWGEPREAHFVIDAAMGRKLSDRKQMAVITTSGRAARAAHTEFTVLEKFGEISLVEAKLATGRTHQVRVHLSYSGHPVVGDPTYGLRLARAEASRLEEWMRRLVEALPGQALHAYQLSFPHPMEGRMLEFEAEPPEQFAQLLKQLRLRAKRSR